MTARPPQTSSLKQFLVIATAAIFTLIGCADRPLRPAPPAGQMDAASAKPTMAAQDLFFDGKLLVEANLGQGFSARGEHDRPGRPGGGRHGGRGMHRGSGTGRRGEERDAPQEQAIGSESGFSIHESTMPPVALHLRLTNKTQETVEITFLLCKSELGDFAVRPEKLTIAPDQSAEPDAMTSRLGLMSGELHLAVRLRMGGKAELKDLVLKAIEPTQALKSANL